MSRLFILAASLTFLSCVQVMGQAAQDRALPVAVIVQENPASILLSWPEGPMGSFYTLRKRIKGAPTWTTLLSNVSGTNYEDTAVSIGTCYEYGVQRGGVTVPAYGYLCAGIKVEPIEYRGITLLVVDQNLLPLESAIQRLQQDIENDGWLVKRLDIDPAEETPVSVKAKITALYNTDPDNTKALFLLGGIPVPYSGNLCPDGHPEHCGAWPADVYYGDINGTWTDNAVSTVSASRPENQNIVGDGKFDQTAIPSTIELQVGRVDFTKLSTATFGVVNRNELYQRYLDKNHTFRQGAYKVQPKILIDDNFGYFGGEAFASSGWRNGYAILGPNAAVAGDLLTDTDNQSFLMIYGCGGGWYQGANGVGSTASFAADSIPAVFSMLFGSYHGDWDSSDNFMAGALANKGGILTCSWAGRPHWYYHHLTLGENIGYSARITQNNGLNSNYLDPGYGAGQVHVALLGDPTVRAHYPTPPTSLVVDKACFSNILHWQAAQDSTITGYHIYRWAEGEATPQRLSAEPIQDTLFVDLSPVQHAQYWVRSFRIEETPSGTYSNLSSGLASGSISRPPLLYFETNSTQADCNGNQLVTPIPSGGVPPYIFLWSNGTEGPTAIYPGGAGYVVILRDSLACLIARMDTTNLVAPLSLTMSGTDISIAGAMDGIASGTPMGGTPPYTFLWNTGASTETLTGLGPGTYYLTVTDSFGCTADHKITLSTIVGVENLPLDELLKAYPNPAHTQLWVNLDGQKGLIQITDVWGKQRWISEVPADSHLISTQEWASGFYWLIWRNESGGILAKKIITIAH